MNPEKKLGKPKCKRCYRRAIRNLCPSCKQGWRKIKQDVLSEVESIYEKVFPESRKQDLIKYQVHRFKLLWIKDINEFREELSHLGMHDETDKL